MPATAQKRSPLHDLLLGLGATFVDLEGWSVPDVFSGVEVEVSAARDSVVLHDQTQNGKIQVEGSDSETVMQSTFDLPELSIGEITHLSGTCVVRLRADLFYLAVSPGEETKTLAEVRSHTGESLVTCTDITSGRAEVRIIGPRAPALMSKVCGLDFADSAFPTGHARQSSVAKTNQLIIRRDLDDLPTYSIIGARSLGAYLWSVLMEAGSEWDIQPVGQSAYQSMEASTS